MWELSRRCKGRQFLLRPDREVVDALLYCFGYCAERWGMLVHVLSLMTNHAHNPVTDVRGQRVEFTHELHGLTARCIKALRGEGGEPMDGCVWEPSEQTGRVMLASEEAFIEACAYAIVNPIEAGLVHNLSEWPSFVSGARDMLDKRRITIKRPTCLPAHYPATATLRFCLPPHLEARGAQVVDTIEARVKERARAARKKLVEGGGRWKTRHEIMNVDPFDGPKTNNKGGLAPALRAANPTVMRAAKKQLVAWRHAYREAFDAFRDGDHGVEWPAGTWFYARYAAARVAPLGAWMPFGAA